MDLGRRRLGARGGALLPNPNPNPNLSPDPSPNASPSPNLDPNPSQARFGPCTVFGGNSIFNGDCGPSSLVGDELGGEEAATSRRMSATPSVGFEEQVARSLAA